MLLERNNRRTEGQTVYFMLIDDSSGTAQPQGTPRRSRPCFDGKNHQRLAASSSTRQLRLTALNTSLILISALIQEHNGDWKCHVADTDLKVRDETNI